MNKEVIEMKKHKEQLGDVYTKLLQVFNKIDHHSVSKNIHVSIFEINQAIKALEKLIEHLTY